MRKLTIIKRSQYKMNRQSQISNKIIQTKHEIDQVDKQIQRETQKQKLLDELIMELDFSNSDESQIQRMVDSRNQSNSSLDQSYVKSHSSDVEKSVRKNESEYIQDSSSVQTEDLSFEIDKIKLFQKDKLYLSKPQPQVTQQNRYKLNEYNFNLEILQQNIPNYNKQKKSKENELKSISNRRNDLNQNNLSKFSLFSKPYIQTKQEHFRDGKMKQPSQLKDSTQRGEFQVRPMTDLLQKAIQRQNQRVQMKTKMRIESQQNERRRLQMMEEQKKLIREELLKEKKQKMQNSVRKVSGDNQEKGQLEFDAKIIKIKGNISKQNSQMLSNVQSNRRKIFQGDEDMIRKFSYAKSKGIEDFYRNKVSLTQTVFIDSSFGNKAVNKYSRYIEKSISSLSRTQSRISSFKQQLKKTKKKSYRLF